MESGGILEVLVVNAQGIRRKNFFGKSAYYVLVQCGTEVRRSKTTKGYHHKAFWNQKFEFELPSSELKNLTHLEISIMDHESFEDAEFVGRAMIFLGGIIAEGNDRGHIEIHPTPYNVVLEDTTYKGEIKIGLNFRVNKDGHKETKEEAVQVMEAGHHFYKSLFRILRISWWRIVFPYGQY
ncbi:hypothetical protein BVRB_1g004690 [Beta vulgaris subsp. vulgaris]|nr:hypothetical protein BVRB_1g004690 [Beta vulgaris subsp. vulgaris]